MFFKLVIHSERKKRVRFSKGGGIVKREKSCVLIIVALLLFSIGSSAQSEARVDVTVGVNIPVYTFPAPPPLVVIPGSYVYAVPDVDVEILFYHGYWYRPYEGRWYRSRSYNGQWIFVSPAKVPHVLIDLPPDYHHFPPVSKRIPYGQFRKNWRRWEKEKYWERDERWREGRHEGRHEGHGGHDGHEGHGEEHHEGGRRY